jgi:2-succinyl-6-hydroxy-2,4-cyclohexadiene-1-carboxylate synthase
MSEILHTEWHGAPRGAGQAPLLLLHGFAGDGTAWEPVRAGLGKAAPLLSVDLVGHGRSPAPEDPARYTLDACVADLEAVLKRERCGPVWAVGYSMGGRVALSLALARPRLLRGVVLVSTHPGLESIGDRNARAEADERLAQQILEKGMEWFAEYWLNLPLFHSLWRIPEDRFNVEHQRRLKQRPEGLVRALRGMGAGQMPSYWDRLDGIDMPCLIVTGGEDERYSALGARMAMRVPGAELARIPEVGHAVHTEQPATFVRTVTAFLRRNEHATLARAE